MIINLFSPLVVICCGFNYRNSTYYLSTQFPCSEKGSKAPKNTNWWNNNGKESKYFILRCSKDESNNCLP